MAQKNVHKTLLFICLAGAFAGLFAVFVSRHHKSSETAVNDATTPLHLLQPAYNVPYGALTVSEVTEQLDKVYAYVEAQTPCRVVDGHVEQLAFRLNSYEWGVTYQALMDAATATKDKKYLKTVERTYAFLSKVVPDFEQRYADSVRVPDRQLNSIIHPQALDDCGAMCTAMMKAKMHSNALGMDTQGWALDSIIERYFRFIEYGQYRLRTNGNDELFARHRPQRNTIWLDDMFMGIPALAFRSQYTSEEKYLNEAITMYWSFVRRMWVPERQLYRHGYVEGLNQQPTYHWARANGWALLTTCELLDAMPETDARREAIIAQLQAHIAGLATLQSSEGFWHQLLDRNDSYLETSATAIYCYCIAHAVRKGWVEGITYGPVAQLAWHAVATKITDEGKVEGTCVGTGMAFDPAFYYYRPVSAAAAHGYGPVIWAAAEMLQLLEQWYPRTNDSGLHYYEQEQSNPSPLFYLTEDGNGEAV